jgi:hypothetical protein
VVQQAVGWPGRAKEGMGQTAAGAEAGRVTELVEARLRGEATTGGHRDDRQRSDAQE